MAIPAPIHVAPADNAASAPAAATSRNTKLQPTSSQSLGLLWATATLPTRTKCFPTTLPAVASATTAIPTRFAFIARPRPALAVKTVESTTGGWDGALAGAGGSAGCPRTTDDT